MAAGVQAITLAIVIVAVAGAVAIFPFITGCDNAPAPEPEFIIRAGSQAVSPEDFARELELKLAAYPHDIKTRPQEYNTMVLDLVSTLSDETALLAEAKRKDIRLSNKELDEAEQKIREDYPEDSFERMLLDNAIEYTVWKKRLEKDMVIQKLIDQELVAAQEISPEDMIAFYKQKEGGASGEVGLAVDEAGLVRQLRLEKSQAAYEQWIQEIKRTAPPEINKTALASFLVE